MNEPRLSTLTDRTSMGFVLRSALPEGVSPPGGVALPDLILYPDPGARRAEALRAAADEAASESSSVYLVILSGLVVSLLAGGSAAFVLATTSDLTCLALASEGTAGRRASEVDAAGLADPPGTSFDGRMSSHRGSVTGIFMFSYADMAFPDNLSRSWGKRSGNVNGFTSSHVFCFSNHFWGPAPFAVCLTAGCAT